MPKTGTSERAATVSKRGGSSAPAEQAPGYRADVLAVLAREMAAVPEVHPGKMFGFPAFYATGRLFACVYGQGVGVKLPRERVAELLQRPDFVPFQPYGKPRMREWVEIRHARAADYARDAPLLAEGARFVATAPKPAARKRPARRPPKG